ncbi:lycopene cyclase domain-containing protein [Halopenitus persicus]|uniref:Lycopene cyclase domain-containing protein n=1 Tax=Halopenitus persicus TaxID=1048396 RepID=A0A1H3ILJ5_9EURY|nr:lycopene cyclase domain-containing protein [Halopenitus persicus]SDY28561.1 lycopene cyclase domain-containing protein [Halopenitus persicus]
MIPPTTYFDVHVTFLLPPILGLGLLAWRRNRLDRRFLGGLAVLIALAVGYTTPWDARLIAIGVWRYGEGAVARRLLGVPLGEYVFFVLQPALTLLWVRWITRDGDDSPRVASRQSPGNRLAGLLAGAAIAVVGGWLVIAGPETRLYLGAILLWAGPVLAIQWAYDWPSLRRRGRTIAVGVLVPTGYLCLVDRIAIDAGIWTIAPAYTTGLTIGGLPVEEGLFFLVTNCFLAQGYLLYDELIERRTADAAGRTAGAPGTEA